MFFGLPRGRAMLSRYAAALLMCALATGAALFLQQWAKTLNISIIYALPVVISAVRLGLGPALFCSVVSVLGCDFFLQQPRYSLAVETWADVWEMLVLLQVALIVSAVAAAARREALAAVDHARRAETLLGLGRALSAAASPREVLEAAAGALSRLHLEPVALALSDGESLTVVSAPPEFRGRDEDAFLAAEDVGSDSQLQFRPLPTRAPYRLAVHLDARNLRPDAEALTDTVREYLALALDRAAFGTKVTDVRVRVANDHFGG